MSGCHAPCDTDSNNSFFDGNEEMGVRFPPTQLIRISVLKPNMERWRNGRRGSYVQYIMFVMLTANITAWGLLHCWFKSNSLQSRRWRKCPYKSRRCANYMSEVAQLVEHETKMDHVCGPNSNLSFHAKDVVGGSSPSLTLYGDVVQREHSSSVKKNVMLVA